MGIAPTTQRWAEGWAEVRDLGSERWGSGMKGERRREQDGQTGHRDSPAHTACGRLRWRTEFQASLGYKASNR